MARCKRTVFWWDTDHVARCALAEHERGLHFDGVRWFDNLGYQRPTDDGLEVARDERDVV